MPLASELICLVITPYCHEHTVFIYSFEGSYKAPFYAGNIKYFIRNSRTPPLKNEPPFPFVSPPCFKHNPLPHLSLRGTGLACGTQSQHNIIMEEKTCAKKYKKKTFQSGNKSDKDAVLVWRIITFDLQCGDPMAPSVPSSLSHSGTVGFLVLMFCFVFLLWAFCPWNSWNLWLFTVSKYIQQQIHRVQWFQGKQFVS